MSKAIVIDADSSSLKWQLYQIPNEEAIAKRIVKRINLKDFIFTIKYGEGQKYEVIVDVDNREVAVKILLNRLIDLNILGSCDEITGVGHHVVADREELKDPVVITDEVLEKIEALSELAPLHNPAGTMKIKAFKHILPEIIGVAVFDTPFRTIMPEHNHLYNIPREYYEKFIACKYGAYGTGHRYVSQRATEMLGRPVGDLKIITCYLGDGASIIAVDGSKSIDTSMGFTPLVGATVGTRSGGVDASLLPYLTTELGLTDVQDMVDILNKKSGLLGLANGLSSDMRDIRSNLDKPEVQTAYNIFIGRICKYIGGYVAVINGVDAVVFTAGIGENTAGVRKDIIDGVTWFGCEIDDDKDNVHGEEAIISTDDSKIKLLLVPTDEELMIARGVERLK